MTLDASQLVPDGLFVRVLVVVDGADGKLPEIRDLAEERVHAALASVDLEIS